MKSKILHDLEQCAYICARLESMISADEEELRECLTGEVYRQYVVNLHNLREAVGMLKRQIYMLHDEQRLIM